MSNDGQQNDQPRESDEQNVGLLRELVELILHNKKWWLAPIILALLVIAVFAVLGSSALAPFIYPMF